MADADALLDATSSGVPAPPTDPPAPPALPDGAVMSLVDHLSELRTRIFRSLLAVVAGSAVGFYFAKPVRDFLLEPLPGGVAQVLGPGDAFAIQLRISVVIGIILAMPVLLYQLWAFVAPGLTPSERQTVRPWIPLALFFFALGVAIARFILPFAVTFLLSFTDDKLVANMAAQPYFDFVTTLFLAFGVLMEFPILLFGLSRVGILSSARLRAARRYVILGISVVAAVATPGTDLVSPLVLGFTMYVLFEITLQVIRRTGR
jgi:sec-independent protein translocase protein TatC